MMETRDPLEWHFKQLDHAMGLSFKANFNFALVGHLLKGWCPTKYLKESPLDIQVFRFVYVCFFCFQALDILHRQPRQEQSVC